MYSNNFLYRPLISYSATLFSNSCPGVAGRYWYIFEYFTVLYLLIYRSVSVRPSVRPSISLCLFHSTSLSLYLSICLFVYLFLQTSPDISKKCYLTILYYIILYYIILYYIIILYILYYIILYYIILYYIILYYCILYYIIILYNDYTVVSQELSGLVWRGLAPLNPLGQWCFCQCPAPVSLVTTGGPGANAEGWCAKRLKISAETNWMGGLVVCGSLLNDIY